MDDIKTIDNTWKKRFWIVIIILFLIGLFFLGRYGLGKYNEFYGNKVANEVSIYQTNTGNIILWNGSERINFLFREGGFKIEDNQIIFNEV